MKRLGLICTYAAFLLLAQPLFAKTPQLPAKTPDYGNLPLTFEPNQGQADASVQFLSHGDSYALALRSGEITLALPSGKQATKKSSPHSASQIQIELFGADPHAASVPEDLQITRTNYFLGNDPSKWRTDIPNYARIHYRSVYPGIDLVYYGNQRHLEHDFVVAPGASPSRISLQLHGVKPPRIDPSTGDLLLDTDANQFRLHKPVTYQQDGDRRIAVDSSYHLLANNRVSFRIGAYNHQRPLVIDPVLTYSTYLTGSGSASGGDQGNAIAVDSAGSAYIAGITYSANFPVTSSAFSQQNYLVTSFGTAFVSKLSPDGSSLIYSTYLGGTSGDQAYGIALDAGGNAYITGATSSSDFPVTCGAFQTVFPSQATATAAFVTRLNATGSALVYSTYLGGSGNQTNPYQGDVAQSIAVDNIGNAYIAGYTWSPDFPTTAKAFQPTFSGSATLSNGFVTKLNPTGTAQLYSTYLGGSGSAAGGDYANSIAIDSTGNAYIAGTTGSTNFPVTDGAFQSSNHGAPSTTNGFVTELNSAGSSEVFSTYLGGSGGNYPGYGGYIGDSAVAIAVDGTGYIFVGGNTGSSDFPVTSDILEGSSYGASAAYLSTFVTRIAPGGASLAYSTHVEGRMTTLSGLAIDTAGNAYLVGHASNIVFPNAFSGFVTTPDALPTLASASQTNSAFLVKLNSTATAMNYATLLGGSGTDEAIAVAVDSQGNAYLTGNTTSSDFTTTAGSFEPTPNPTGNPNPGSLLPVTLSVEAGSALVACHRNGTYNLSLTIQISADPSKAAPTGTVNFFGNFGAEQANLPIVPGSNGISSIALSASGTDSADILWKVRYSGDSTHAPGGLEETLSCSGGSGSGQPGVPAPSSKAFVSKFALAAETNQTTYPPVPTALQTALIVDSQSWESLTYCGIGFSDGIFVTVTLYTNQIGPQLNSDITLTTVAGGFTDFQQIYGVPPPSGIQIPLMATGGGINSGAWNITFGDPSWGTLSLSGDAPLWQCPNSAAHSPARRAAKLSSTQAGSPTPSGSTAHASIHASVSTQIAPAKFTPPIFDRSLALARPAAKALDTPGCIAPINLKPLTIRIVNGTRLYGAANPVIPYSVTGLSAGDTVTVTPTPDAAATSPAGTYPISASISGSNLANYDVQIIPGTLTVEKAPLYLSAKNVALTYGQTPPPLSAYSITGFVNGDTAAVVTGAPVLTTSVTATTPVGVYPITVSIGSLTAQNYYFNNFSNGEGAVYVYKAPLHIKPNSVTIHAGDPIPTFTYTLSGFVNGETQASATTGGANLTTTAAQPTKVGRYYIIGAQGSLQAHNYSFLSNLTDYGILTVLP